MHALRYSYEHRKERKGDMRRLWNIRINAAARVHGITYRSLIHGMKMADIFKEFGEKRFREMEKAFFIEKAKKPGQIFSTGGGIVLEKQNRNVLQNNGICFFLDASPQLLAQRIHNTDKRPLLADSENLENRLKTIWQDRSELYKNSAHHIIKTDKL